MTHDVVIIGAGPESLVAAAYLARAGRSVQVLERRPEIGGRAVDEELAPGFRCPATFVDASTFDPEVAAELRLGELGYTLLDAGGVLVPEPGGEALFLPPPAAGGGDGEGLPAAAVAALARRSTHDAAALAELDGFLRRLARAFAPVLQTPLPDLAPGSLGDLVQLIVPGLRLRRLGRRDLAEAMRFLPMPIADVLAERFETPALCAALAADGVRGAWLGPRSPGSAMNLLLHRCGSVRGAIGYPRFVAGGVGRLTGALADAARAAGARIRTEAEVAEILVRDGATTGVVLRGGEEVAGRAVLSGADPRHTLLELLAPGHLDPSFLLAARRVRSRGTVAFVHFALDRLPQIAGAPDDPRCLAGRIQVGATLEALERAFDDGKYGRLPARPFIDLTIPSLADPSLAPAGRHVMSAWVQFPPHALRERSWDEARDELAATVEAAIAEVAPGFADAVAARRVLTPQDLETRFGLTGGCLYHVEPALDQLLYMRPLPRWSRHATPIRQLFLGGAGCHGGGPLTGLAGRNAARQLLRAG